MEVQPGGQGGSRESRPAARAPSGEQRHRARRKGLFSSPFFRFLPLAAAVCSFPIMLRASQGALRYSDWHAFRFLVAGTVIAAAWALFTLLCDLLLLCMGCVIHSVAFLLFLVLGDFVAMFLSLGAGSAAGGITTANDQGLSGRPFVCTGSTPFNSLCARTKAATAMAVIASAFFIPALIADICSLGQELYEEEDLPQASR